LFPATAFCAFIGILKSRSWAGASALGLALGLCLAGCVFILYPPWQVSVGYLFVFLTAGVMVRDRLWRDLGARHAAALGVAALISGLLVAAWWGDATDAIHAMQSTVYPGQRTTIPGGGVRSWEWLRGFANSFTLYYPGATGSNQSESSSFLYFFPPVIVAALAGAWRKALPTPPELALLVFCLIVLWFQFVGIPPRLAEWTLWGRVQPKRTDLALGLASVLLCSLSLTSGTMRAALTRTEAFIIAAGWSFAVVLVMRRTPPDVAGDVPLAMWLLPLPVLFLLTYWLLAKYTRYFLAGSLFATCSISLPFHPLIRAPKSVEPVGEVLMQAKQRHQHVVVLGSQIEAMGLLAAGVPVANGVFYYPQSSLWKRLDPEGKDVALTNRYQHLIYAAEKMDDGGSYKLESPHPDVVRVRFDPTAFNFRLTTAQLIVAPISVDLSANPSVKLLVSGARYTFYRVL
jgi:hypothetical protein